MASTTEPRQADPDGGGLEGIERVRKWIRETGYPLEYATARTLTKLGYQALQGVHYQGTSDADRRPREIDVVGLVELPMIEGSPLPDEEVVVQLVVECKVLRLPWVVLTREGRLPWLDLLRMAIASVSAIRHLTAAAEASGEVPDLFASPTRMGFSAVEARIPTAGERKEEARSREERVDGAYAALQQVASASRALISGTHGYRLCWPIVVVRGPLFHLGYTESGDELLEPVEWTRVMWSGHAATTTAIDIVRERHLEAYARMALKGLEMSRQRLTTVSNARRAAR